MSKQSFAIGGVHPHDNKLARDSRTVVLPPAPTMYVSVAQHLGAPALPVVQVGDKVKVGVHVRQHTAVDGLIFLLYL